MKKIVFACIALVLLQLAVVAQGSYAGIQKKLLNKTFGNDRKIPGLTGYIHTEGELITEAGGEESQYLDVYSNGKSAVVVYNVCTDTAKKIFKVLDVIYFPKVLPGWQVKIVGCTEGATEEEILITLVKPGNGQYATTVQKAWLCERDRLKIEAIGVKNVKCLNEGYGQ
ncbi:MAG: hypothetical protein JST86_17070 [Bacteroidetes bacterium]|nr:hypothetical protein [Bacteroidota bacterium]